LEGVDLDGDVRRVDPDRWLASRFIADPRARADVVSLYAFDHELARANAATSTALMAQIRLSWWREGVDAIYAGGPVRRHPTLEALATTIRSRGLTRDHFEAMIETRLGAAGMSRFAPGDALAWARGAQGALAQLSAQILGGPAQAELAAPAGAAWGLALLRGAGVAGGEAFDTQLRAILSDARISARRMSAAAFPAVLCATLVDRRARTASELEKRARLTLAALTGRL
jgi:phytoene synthase